MLKVNKAFTLIEMLLVISIFGAVATLSLPFLISSPLDARLEKNINEIKGSLMDQQSYAYSRNNNKKYGVAFSSNNYSVFTGDTLATAEDHVTYPLEKGVTISSIYLTGGTNEILFDIGNYQPAVTGGLNLTDGFKTYQIRITTEGLVYSNKL